MNLEKYTIENIIERDEKKYFYDNIRKREILITPEEIIRQKVIQYLIEELDVPVEALDEETPLSYYKFPSNRRPDILILGKNVETGDSVPAVVIECKAPNVILYDEVFDQTLYYANNLQADYILITNGKEYVAAVYDFDKQRYVDIEELPRYDDLFNYRYKAKEIDWFESFERRGEKSIRLGAYILIKDIIKGRRVKSSAFAA